MKLICLLYPNYLSFTSGTTGVPKGVMLTHTNIIAGIIGSTHVAMVGQLPEDTYLAYLPLAHIFEIMSEYTMMAARVPIGFAVGIFKYIVNYCSLLALFQTFLFSTAKGTCESCGQQ